MSWIGTALERFPGRPCIVGESVGVLTYARVGALVEGRVRDLRRELQLGSPVAFVAERDLDTLINLLSLAEMGLPAAPISPDWTEAERSDWISAVKPQAFLDKGQVHRCAHARRLTGLWVLPTSGSSGRPKGVVLSRHAIEHAAASSAAHLAVMPDDRWYLSLPLCHVGGLSIMFRMVLLGGAMVLGRGGSFSPAHVANEMSKFRVTLWSAVPSMLVQMLESQVVVPDSLRATLVGGAHAPPSLLREADARGFGTLATYGMTETCAQVFTEPLNREKEDRSSGQALLGVETRIRDGELWLRTPTLLEGYLEENGVESPLQDGWFPTGDLAKIRGGNLFLLGRKDGRILTGGENVDPFEVEIALAALGLGDACVFGVSDPKWGQRVCAAVTGRGDFDAVRDALRSRLVGYKCPKEIHFDVELPRLASGKLDRQAIQALYATEQP